MLTEVSLARFIAGKPVKVVVAAVKKRRELYCDVNKSLFNDWLNLKHWLTKLTYSNLQLTTNTAASFQPQCLI